jgi:hypothetical protein
MSQQGPGGYGGGGPHGPPGGGGYGGPPPGGYPPPPPGGYGPPGGQPPGGYGPPGPGGYGGPPGYGAPGAPPPGYGPAQWGGAAPGGSPSPSKSPLIWVGLGCGVLFLLGAVGGVIAFLSARSKQAEAEKQVEAVASSIAQGASTALTPAVPASGVCAKTVACCQAVASKSGSNADLAVKACAAYANLSDAVCAQQYPALKQAATAMGGLCE